METVISKLKKEIQKCSFDTESYKYHVQNVTFYRFKDEKIQMPQTENPYLYIVINGTLRLYTPSGIMDYIEGQYSISKIDTPLSGTVLTFSEEQEFLAIAIEFTVNDVITTVLDIDNSLIEKIMNEAVAERDMSISDKAVIQSVYRLVTQEIPSEFMQKNILREIIYYILCGSCGKQFMQNIINIQKADKIYEANSWIKRNFRDTFTVEDLSEQRNMSVSLFHQKFKSAVGMGPLQCQKRLRLTEARPTNKCQAPN